MCDPEKARWLMQRVANQKEKVAGGEAKKITWPSYSTLDQKYWAQYEIEQGMVRIPVLRDNNYKEIEGRPSSTE